MQESYIVNKKTGEITGEVHEGDRMLPRKSVDYLKRQRELVEVPEQINQFFKGNITEIKLILEELDIYEKGMLFTMASYVGYDDCCLKYGNGNDVTATGLIRLSGLGKNKTLEVIESLAAKDIIYRGKNSRNRQYFVNPWIFCKGNKIDKVLKTMFKNYKIRSLDNIQWKELKE